MWSIDKENQGKINLNVDIVYYDHHAHEKQL